MNGADYFDPGYIAVMHLCHTEPKIIEIGTCTDSNLGLFFLKSLMEYIPKCLIVLTWNMYMDDGVYMFCL